jgi:REP element-mobilizing transposase RayT
LAVLLRVKARYKRGTTQHRLQIGASVVYKSVLALPTSYILQKQRQTRNFCDMASDQYFIRNQNEIHFLTMTVVDWVDVFTRKEHKLRITDSLRYCQQQKGLIIYGWCLMSNHLHLLAAANEGFHLSDILRDFKKFTSKQIVAGIQLEIESRREWMLYRFQYAGKFTTNVKEYKFWQVGNHAEECFSHNFAKEKLNYIHQNPVRSLIVDEPEQYLFSSARDYAGFKGMLEIEFI